jgi:hypothetical protein
LVLVLDAAASLVLREISPAICVPVLRSVKLPEVD